MLLLLLLVQELLLLLLPLQCLQLQLSSLDLRRDFFSLRIRRRPLCLLGRRENRHVLVWMLDI